MQIVARIGQRIAQIGAAPGDDEAVRAQKATLALAAVVITMLSIVWVLAYLALELPRSAAIPFTYQVPVEAGLRHLPAWWAGFVHAVLPGDESPMHFERWLIRSPRLAYQLLCFGDGDDGRLPGLFGGMAESFVPRG